MRVRKVLLFSNQNFKNRDFYFIFKMPQIENTCVCVCVLTCCLGSNQRKRGREANNQQFPLQSQFPQVIDLSLLHNHNHQPSKMVYTGLRLSSGEDQTRKMITNLFQQNIPHRNLVSISYEEDVVATHINRQSEELDEFLHAQVLILPQTIWVFEKS